MAIRLNIQDVSISEDGCVTIKNAAFAKELIDHVKKVAPGSAGIFDNCNCSENFLKEINLRKVLPVERVEIDPGVIGIFDNCNCKGRIVGPEIVSR